NAALASTRRRSLTRSRAFDMSQSPPEEAPCLDSSKGGALIVFVLPNRHRVERIARKREPRRPIANVTSADCVVLIHPTPRMSGTGAASHHCAACCRAASRAVEEQANHRHVKL